MAEEDQLNIENFEQHVKPKFLEIIQNGTGCTVEITLKEGNWDVSPRVRIRASREDLREGGRFFVWE